MALAKSSPLVTSETSAPLYASLLSVPLPVGLGAGQFPYVGFIFKRSSVGINTASAHLLSSAVLLASEVSAQLSTSASNARQLTLESSARTPVGFAVSISYLSWPIGFKP